MHLQRREDHWAIVDLIGKGGHVRTVPVPEWVKTAIDSWLASAEIKGGRLFRCVCRAGKTWGDGMTERVVGMWSKTALSEPESRSWRLMIYVGRARAFAMQREANSNRSNFSSGTCPSRQLRSISAVNSAYAAQ